MPGTKYQIVAVVFVILFVMALFGARYGWTVDGVPRGLNAADKAAAAGHSVVRIPIYWANTDDIAYYVTGYYADDGSFVYLGDISADPESGGGTSWWDGLGDAGGYLWDMATFQIDGMPYWFSGFVDLVILMMVLIIAFGIRGTA